MTTIYLSGPMTGLPDLNYPAFHEAAAKLRAEGHVVYNPAEYPHEGPAETFPLNLAFAEFYSFICLESEAIAMLPGWEQSEGAQAEHMLASRLAREVIILGEPHI